MNAPNSTTSLTGKIWLRPEPVAGAVAPHPELPAWGAELLARRGVVGPEAITHYLAPSLSRLDDPASIADMPKACARIEAALKGREKIVVYGDYDVDGVCSSTILVEFLRQVGAEVDFYIPHRRNEGYGLNEEAVREVAGRCDLIITTDTGISAHHEIAVAKELGVDVIVVDHHQVPDTLPEAVACLNPQRADCAYPFKDCCAAGVAFLLVVALRRHLRERGYFAKGDEPDVRPLLDVLAVATVADMVPLNGTNRLFVAAGLRRLADAPRLGLAALMRVSKINPKSISASDLGFRIGPRINARGRLGHAAEAVELMLTDNQERAIELARQLDEANIERRRIEKNTVDDAIAMAQQSGAHAHAGIVLYNAEWHPGVLGLVASRLAKRFNRPTIIVGEGGKGSGRSIEGCNLYNAIGHGADHLIRFGGHPAAAGITIAPENLAAFRETFIAAVGEQLGPPPYTATLAPDIEVDGAMLTPSTLDVLDRLAPFGQKNPEPLMVAHGLRIAGKRIVGDAHLKLQLGTDGYEAIAFGMADLADSLPEVVDVAFRLERDTFRGGDAMQLRIEDLRRAGAI